MVELHRRAHGRADLMALDGTGRGLGSPEPGADAARPESRKDAHLSDPLMTVAVAVAMTVAAGADVHRGDDDLDQGVACQLHAYANADRQLLGIDSGIPHLVQFGTQGYVRNVDHGRQNVAFGDARLGGVIIDFGQHLFGLPLDSDRSIVGGQSGKKNQVMKFDALAHRRTRFIPRYAHFDLPGFFNRN